MFELESVGMPISQGLRVTANSGGAAVFARCQYVPLAGRGSEFSGLELAEYLEGERKTVVIADKIYVYRFRLTSTEWTEIHKWIAWADSIAGFQFAYKEITDKIFSVCPLTSLYNTSLSALAIEGVPQLSVSITMEECRTLAELATNLSQLEDHDRDFSLYGHSSSHFS